MSTRTFTLEESRMLLPVLESLLRTAIEGKKFIEEVDAAVHGIVHLGVGGALAGVLG